MKEIETLQLAQKTETTSAYEQIKALQTKLDQHGGERDALKVQLENVQKELQAAAERSKQVDEDLKRLQEESSMKSQLEAELAHVKAASKRLEQENQMLETRAMEAEEKISLLLDQVENSVDTYRRSIVVKRSDGNSPPISPRSSSIGNRTSVALDSLAHELDQLRSHWESSTHRYRLSTSSLGRESPTTGLGLLASSFDFETPRGTSADSDGKVNGIRHDGESIPSRWRDELDSTTTIQSPHPRQVTA